MKKLLFIAFLLTSTAAMAQTAPAPATGTPPAQNAQKFAEHKTEALKRLSDRMAEIQQRQSCVQGAADGEALKACFPDRGEHKGKAGCGPESR